MIYIFSRFPNVYGIKIIIEELKIQLQKQGHRVEIINSLNKREKNAEVIPYGITEAILSIAYLKKIKIAYLADVISYSYIEVAFHKDLNFNSLYKLEAVLKFLLYRFMEFLIGIFYEKVIIVNEWDMKNISKIVSPKKIFLIKNGIYIPKHFEEINENKSIIFGVFSTWGLMAQYDLLWFLKNKIPNKLFVYGKGITKQFREKLDSKLIQVHGAVDSPKDVYKNIDFLLVTSIKSCGILNKVLESLAHNTPVIGFKRNLYWIADNPLVHIINKPNDLDLVTKKIISNKDKIRNKNILQKRHNWEKNMKPLIDYITSKLSQ